MTTDHDEAIAAATQRVQEAYAALADLLMPGTPRGAVITIYDYGLNCDKCGEAWDGFFSFDTTNICRECGGRFIRWAMEATR